MVVECQQPLAVLDDVGGVLTPQNAKEDVVGVRAAAEAPATRPQHWRVQWPPKMGKKKPALEPVRTQLFYCLSLKSAQVVRDTMPA